MPVFAAPMRGRSLGSLGRATARALRYLPLVSETPAKPAEDGPTGDAEDRIVRARARRQASLEDEEIPKLPRGKGIRGVSRGQWIKIMLTGGLLVMLLVIQKPCADSVSSFVTGFDDPGSAASRMPKPGTVDGTGRGSNSVLIRGDMSEAEMKAALERAGLKPNDPETKNAAGSGSGGAGSGSNR
jgi:hypothetical protein